MGGQISRLPYLNYRLVTKTDGSDLTFPPSEYRRTIRSRFPSQARNYRPIVKRGRSHLSSRKRTVKIFSFTCSSNDCQIITRGSTSTFHHQHERPRSLSALTGKQWPSNPYMVEGFIPHAPSEGRRWEAKQRGREQRRGAAKHRLRKP